MEELLRIAETSSSEGRHCEALVAYLQAARQYPACNPQIRDGFLSTLSTVLNSPGKDFRIFSKEVLANLDSLPTDETALTMIGVKLLNEGCSRVACYFLEAALKADPDSLFAKENLQIAYSKIVDRWHFHMLNDVVRNSTFCKSIERVVSQCPDCCVLDIGSGTGILSMMAVKAGAKSVYACEVNETMVTVSHDILAANGIQDDITLLHALSTTLSVPVDIPKRVDLVVAEVVDAGLLGEHIIPTLRHAWRELLLPRQPAKPTNQIQQCGGGHVIPCGATVYAMVIECPEIRKQTKLLSTGVAGLSFGDLVLEGTCYGNKTPAHNLTQLAEEPYTSERLSQIRGGYKALTQSSVILQFDFSDPEVPLPTEAHVQLPVFSSGRVDAIATWFDLHLDSCISLSTSPSWYSCWEQAIFPVQGDITVQDGDLVLLSGSCSETLLKVTVEDVVVKRREIQREATAVSTRDTAVMREKQTYFIGNKHFVERSTLSRLNDHLYIEAYRRALSQSIAAVRECDSSESDQDMVLESDQDMVWESDQINGGEESQSQSSGFHTSNSTCSRDLVPSDSDRSSEERADCIVLDMGRGMSLLGLLAANEGADFLQIARTPLIYQELSTELAKLNRIQDKVSFKYMEFPSSMAAPDQPMWDIVVCDVVSPQGVLHTAVFEELVFLRSQYFHSQTVILPYSMTVHAVCISSPALRAQSSVLGTIPTLGFNIAQFTNHYQVSHFIDLDLVSFPHTLITEPFQLLSVDLNSLGDRPLRVERKVHIPVKADGIVTGIAYWFSLGLHGNITLSTGLEGYQGSHWHQSVFLLPEDVSVSKGQQLLIRGLLKDSCLDISAAV